MHFMKIFIIINYLLNVLNNIKKTIELLLSIKLNQTRNYLNSLKFLLFLRGILTKLYK